jgi:peptidoglycan hydrolase CwlO-like protein
MSSTAQQHGLLAPAEAAKPSVTTTAAAIERLIVWVGSPASLALHTVAFIAAFALSIFHVAPWDTMLLVLTTVVSLEAIYLAIFIQFSVNRQAASLKGVEEDVESIQEDVEELGEHVEGIKEDVEEIQEDLGEISEDSDEELRKKRQTETLEALTKDVKALLLHLETLQGR